MTLANGSGFIVSEKGLVLTNAHVVENKSHVNIKLHDGSNFDGVVTVVDPVSDLAVIKMQTDVRQFIYISIYLFSITAKKNVLGIT